MPISPESPGSDHKGKVCEQGLGKSRGWGRPNAEEKQYSKRALSPPRPRSFCCLRVWLSWKSRSPRLRNPSDRSVPRGTRPEPSWREQTPWPPRLPDSSRLPCSVTPSSARPAVAQLCKDTGATDRKAPGALCSSGEETGGPFVPLSFRNPSTYTPSVSGPRDGQ